LGMEGGDMHWMSRYLLMRVGELFNVAVSFDPKPVPGDPRVLLCCTSCVCAVECWSLMAAKCVVPQDAA
jgi:hypothetical protein